MNNTYFVARNRSAKDGEYGFLVRSTEPLFRDNVNGMWHSHGSVKYDCSEFEEIQELANLQWEDEPVQVNVDVKLVNIKK